MHSILGDVLSTTKPIYQHMHVVRPSFVLHVSPPYEGKPSAALGEPCAPGAAPVRGRRSPLVSGVAAL